MYGNGVPVEPDVKTYAASCSESISGTRQGFPAGAGATATAPVLVPATASALSGYITLGKSMVHPGSSVRQNTSRANTASCRMTSGVWVDGSRLTFPETRLAANPTVNRYRSEQTFRTWSATGRAAATRATSARKSRARTGTPERYATTAAGSLCEISGSVPRRLLCPVRGDVFDEVS